MEWQLIDVFPHFFYLRSKERINSEMADRSAKKLGICVKGVFFPDPAMLPRCREKNILS